MSILKRSVGIVCLSLAAQFSYAADAAPSAPYAATDADLAALTTVLQTAQKGELDPATKSLDEMIAAHPTWIAAIALRAQVLQARQQNAPARDAYQSILTFDPDNRDALLGVATTSSKLGEHVKAIAAIDHILAKTPADGQAALMRVDELIQNNQKADAAKYIASILNAVKGADRPQLFPLLVPLQLKAEDYAAAEVTANEWIAARPTEDGYAYRADALRGQKKYAEAMADLEAGFKLTKGQPTYPLMAVGAQLLQDRGDIAAAIGQWVDLLELTPHNQEVERAIEQAVLARQAQIATDKNKDASHDLVPAVKAAPGQFEQWKLRQTIGEIQIEPMLNQINRAQRDGEQPLAKSYRDARKIYPAHEVYAAHIDFEIAFTLDPATTLLSPEVTAELAARDFRVAAAIASLQAARGTGDPMLLNGYSTGYLAWADIEQHIHDGNANEGEKLLVKGHDLEVAHDDLGALQAYEQARVLIGGEFAGPQYTLSNRISNNKARLGAVLATLRGRLDQALARDDVKQAQAIANQMKGISQFEPETMLAKARMLQASGKKEEYTQAVKTLVDSHEDCDAGHLLLALNLEAAGETDEALLQFNMAARGLEKAAEDVAVQAIAARQRLEKGRPLPTLRQLYATHADEAYQAEHWTEAMACAERLKFGFEKPAAGVYIFTGTCAQRLFLNAQAVRDLNQALAIDPKANAFGPLGEAQAEAGDFKAALASFDNAIAAAPDQPYYYRQRALAWRSLGEMGKAQADFKTAILKGDDSGKIKLELADSLKATDPKAAAEVYAQIITGPIREHEMFAGPMIRRAKAELFMLQRGIAGGH